MALSGYPRNRLEDPGHDRFLGNRQTDPAAGSTGWASLRIYDLAHTNYYDLKSQLGIMGAQLYAHSWGIDRSFLGDSVKVSSKSIGNSQVLNKDYLVRSEDRDRPDRNGRPSGDAPAEIRSQGPACESEHRLQYQLHRSTGPDRLPSAAEDPAHQCLE